MAGMLIKALIGKTSGRFVLVGAANTSIDAIAFALLFQIGVSLILANTLAFFMANIASYILNRNFTFSDTSPVFKSKLLHYAAFLFLSLCTLALSNIFLIY